MPLGANIAPASANPENDTNSLCNFSVHLPTENGLPPYSVSTASTNMATSNASGGTQSTITSFNEQHNVGRLSSPLSVNRGPSPISANSTPPHTEQPSLTPMKSMAQNQDPVDKVMLDMPHMDGSRSKLALKLRP